MSRSTLRRNTVSSRPGDKSEGKCVPLAISDGADSEILGSFFVIDFGDYAGTL